MSVPARPALAQVERKAVRSARRRRAGYGAVALACLVLSVVLIGRNQNGGTGDIDLAAVQESTVPPGTPLPLPLPLDDAVHVGWLPEGYSIHADRRVATPDRALFTREQGFYPGASDTGGRPILVQIVESTNLGAPEGEPRPADVETGTVFVSSSEGGSRVEFRTGDDVTVVVSANFTTSDVVVRVAESIELVMPSCIEQGVVTGGPACSSAEEESYAG